MLVSAQRRARLDARQSKGALLGCSSAADVQAARKARCGGGVDGDG